MKNTTLDLTAVAPDDAAVVALEDVAEESLSGSSPRERSAGRPSGSLRFFAGVALAAVALGAAAVAGKRILGENESPKPATPTAEARSVRVVRPSPVEDSALTLPANLDGLQSTLLYSRVNGYVRKWQADIGDRVKKGQVLAEIDTPEADQELEQAQAALKQGKADLETARAELREAELSLKQAAADLARAKANSEYSQGVFARNTTLRRQGVIAQQDFDDSRRDQVVKQAEIDAAEAQHRTHESMLATRGARIRSREAAVNGLEASVRRLTEMQAFKKILAPFDGVVARRRAEVGMLVSAGNPQTSQELFAVAQADKLRVRIHVPQAYAPSIQAGQPAKVLAPEYPSRTFAATIARKSGSIDPASRTLDVELELDNREGLLLPGSFGKVILPVRRPEGALSIPVNALVARSDGTHAAVVDRGGVVKLRKLQLGRDYGRTVEVLSGVTGQDSIVVNPPDDLADGETVVVQEPTPSVAKPKAP